MKKIIFVLFTLTFLNVVYAGGTKTFELKTNLGDITVELDYDKAPVTADNFAQLALNEQYDGTIFHRVIEGFMIQGGDYENFNGTGGQAFGGGMIDNEISDLSHVRGALSMANAGPDTNGSQFFIVHQDALFLDGSYSVFGRVIAGMDIVDAIASVKTGAMDRPVEDVILEKVTPKVLEQKIPVLNTIHGEFPDIDPTSIEGKAAILLESRDIIKGYPDGTFGGDLAVNRAEASKILVLMLEPNFDPKSVTNAKFPDTPTGVWYTPYITRLSDLGIIDGYEDGFFRPSEQVNRAEFTKMIVEAFDLPQGGEHSFQDVDSSAWFNTYLGTADYYDFYPKQLGVFAGAEPLSRNEVVVALYQYLQLAANRVPANDNSIYDLAY